MWVHVLPGRVRVRVPGLRNCPALGALLARRLAARPGVLGAAPSPATGTMVIRFDPAAVSLADLAGWLAPAHAAEAAATAEPVGPAPDPGAVAAAPALLPPAPDPGALAAAPPGLAAAEVARLRARHGPNVLPPPPRPPFLRRLLDQYAHIFPLTLAAGAGLSLLSGHRRDALTVGAVLLLNGVIGAAQAGGPSRSTLALAGLAGEGARVIRDGVRQTVPAADLVPGDVLALAAGERVPADAAVTAAAGLAVDEGLLTGEWAAVDKGPGDSLAAGSAVVRGRCLARVTATGMAGTLGQMAALLAQPEPPAPLQRHLDGLGRRVARAGLWLAAGAAGVGLLRGRPPVAALLAGASLAVSALPEGLPALVTLALAAGARRMADQGGSFQNLDAVATMGAVDVLCCDKTGTLTGGEMTVTELYLPDAVWQATGSGYSPEGEFRRNGRPAEPLADPAMRRLLKVAALCTDARLVLDSHGALAARGDPTDVALLAAALKAGLRTCGGDGDRLLELPFDPLRRRMTVVCRDGAGHAVACTKGAPEAVLPLCTRSFAGGAVRKLDGRLRRHLARATAAMTGRGLRVLAVAYRPVPVTVRTGQCEQDLVLLGLVGLADPPRPEAAAAVARCRAAGVRVVMLTGDHPATAAAVAREIGLLAPGDLVLTGAQVSAMDDAALRRAVGRLRVYARVSPEQKLGLVRTLQGCGHTVAMVGDGVNDAPAMQAADVGIAMGGRGNAVARAAAGLVLADDHLPTAVAAMAQGRATGRNVRRVARYLLGATAAEVCLLGASLLLGQPLPLLPAQLLWLNLAGDLVPATLLGAEPPEPGLMAAPPPPAGDLPGPEFSRQVLAHGLGTGLAATGVFAWALAAGRPLAGARTLAMITLAAGQVRHFLALRRPGAAQTGPRPPGPAARRPPRPAGS